MRREILSLLNRLDGYVRPVDAPDFEYRVSVNDEGNNTFVISGLKVWLYRDRGDWIAQGLDIGFAASGRNVDDAINRFMRGLFATIELNLRNSGSLNEVVRPAEPEYWLAWRNAVRHSNKSENDRSAPPRPDLFNGSFLNPQFYCS
ncbi:MAG: hypothetical protein WD672_15430 [Woeseia sp.]